METNNTKKFVMKQTEIIFEDSMGGRTLIDYHRRGFTVLCRYCSTPLIFVLDEESIIATQRYYRIYCPRHEEHLEITFNVG